MAKKKRFPRTLYKKGGSQRLHSGGKSYEYSSEIVENEEEYKAAMATGYLDSFNDAIFGKEVESEPEYGDKDDF